MSDPAHGGAALANPRVLAGLLGDLLPDAPRESGLLLAAAEKNVAGALRDHVRQGMDIATAVSLTSSSLAASTAYGPEVCEWVTTEFAIALDLGVPPQQPAPPPPQQPAPHPQQPAPPCEAAGPAVSAWSAATSPPARAYAQYLPTEAAGQRPPPMAGLTPQPDPVRPVPAAAPRPRRGLRVVAVLGLAVILAVALAAYALIRTSANGSSAAGAAPPGTSAPSPAAHASTSASGLPGSGTSGSTAPAGTAGSAAGPPSWSGIWIAQLASVAVGDGRARLSAVLAKIRLKAPSAQVLTSTRYASLNPDYWVIYAVGGFTDGDQALRFCAARGWTDKSHCVGRYLSHDHADFGYQCYPPAAAPSGNCLHPAVSPAEVVESYLTSVNMHDWQEAWQLGGKNLGQSYSQLIANYRQTRRILISRLTATGDSVSVRTVAYKTDGTEQRYALKYEASNGVIVAGRSTLISTG